MDQKNRGRYRRKSLWFCLMLAAAGPVLRPHPASAQADPRLEAARAQLLGSRPRTWVKERVEMSMGPRGVCTKGETYAFSGSGQVTIRKCTNSVLTSRTVPWRLRRLDALDPSLVLDGREYRLSFGGTARAPKMRWRRLAEAKADPTTDIYLGLSRD